MRKSHKVLITLLLGTVALAAALGCGDSKDPSAAANTTPVSSTVTSSTVTETPKADGANASATDASAKTGTASAAPEAAPPAPSEKVDPQDLPKDGEKVAVIDTNLGQIVFKFLSKKAPNTVDNFKKLAGKKFYDGTKFHRVIPGFMIQGGDPNTKPGGEANGPAGTGGPGYSIKAEFNDTHHGPGIVSMARSQDPDSAGSQFFICVGDAGFLDNQYTAFGKVVKGMDVVNKIVQLPRGESQQDMPNAGHEAIMKSVRIETWPLK